MCESGKVGQRDQGTSARLGAHVVCHLEWMRTCVLWDVFNGHCLQSVQGEPLLSVSVCGEPFTNRGLPIMFLSALSHAWNMAHALALHKPPPKPVFDTVQLKTDCEAQSNVP